MKKEIGLFVLAVLSVLIVLYRRRHAGKRQVGLHLQASGITFAWLGGVLAFAMDRVELGAKAVLFGFAIGLIGLFVQTRRKGD